MKFENMVSDVGMFCKQVLVYSLVPRPSVREKTWYALCAHARNFTHKNTSPQN